MTLIQLIYFNEIVRTGNFTSAANRLYVSQPSLSYAIRELEEELGAPLFVRHRNKQITLTESGRILLPHAQAILQNIDDAKNKVQGIDSTPASIVRIECFWSGSITILPVLIRYFPLEDLNKRVKLEFEVWHDWCNLEERLRKKQTDLVVSAGKFAHDCCSEVIGYQRIHALIPTNHPLAARSTLTIRDVKEDPLIMISAGSNLDAALKRIFAAEGISPQCRYVPEWCSQMLQVSVGNGIGLNTDYPFQSPLVNKIPLTDEGTLLPVYLSWASELDAHAPAGYVRDYLLAVSRQITNE